MICNCDFRAVTFETVKTLDACLQNISVVIQHPAKGGQHPAPAETFFEVQNPSDVLIHQDGFVSKDSFLVNSKTQSPQKRRKNIFSFSICKIVFQLDIDSHRRGGKRGEEGGHLMYPLKRLIKIVT